MKRLTTAEMIRNVEIALFYWNTIPRKNVFRQLAGFVQDDLKIDVENRIFADRQAHNCGTVACFGGWVPAMPEFAAMGIRTTSEGMPHIKLKHHPALMGASVAGYLFGKDSLFYSRWDCAYDDLVPRSDHAVVTRRLTKHLAFLKNSMVKS